MSDTVKDALVVIGGTLAAIAAVAMLIIFGNATEIDTEPTSVHTETVRPLTCAGPPTAYMSPVGPLLIRACE